MLLYHSPASSSSSLQTPSPAWVTASPQSPPINPLWKPSAPQVKFNQHDFPIFTSLCCSETCYATLSVSAQSYDISEFPIPPLPDASDGHFLLCTPPPKATHTFHLLESALHSPLLVKSGTDFDIQHGHCASSRSKQNKGIHSYTGTSAIWLCPLYPKYFHSLPSISHGALLSSPVI